MPMNLKGRSFVKLVDLSNDEIQELIELSLQLKQQRKTNKISTELKENDCQLFQQSKTHHQLVLLMKWQAQEIVFDAEGNFA